MTDGTTVESGPDRAARYTSAAIILHWAIAALILYNLTSGLLRDFLPREFFTWHVSSGITILILSVVRVGWRLTHRPPPLLPMQRWEKRLAHGVHFLLYAAILFVPFAGWALISASPPPGTPGAAYAAEMRAKADAELVAKGGKPKGPGRSGPRMFWGIAPIPLIGAVNTIGATPEGVKPQRELRERIEKTHEIGGWLMFLLLLLHVAGALKHQFADRVDELARMGLGRRRKPETEAG